MRFFPPGVLFIALALGFFANRWYPLRLEWPVPKWVLEPVGLLIALGPVLFLGVWPLVLFRKSGQDPSPWTSTPSLERRGPYRFTRNPMYLQMVLICLGVGMATANLWTVVATPAVAWVLWRVAIQPEEAYLEARFGSEYLEYKQRVRRWL